MPTTHAMRLGHLDRSLSSLQDFADRGMTQASFAWLETQGDR
jgi:hypothetical protein